MCPFNDHDNDHDLAAAIAHAAGGLLNMVRASPLLHGKQRGHAGDTVANAFITQLLQAQRGGDGFLSEETAPDPARLDKPRVWIIDPLDGTREYGELELGREDWAVHIALTEHGHPTACAVGLPAAGLVFSTASPPAIPAAPPGKLKIVVSRSRAPAIAQEVADALDAELLPMGSAGAKAMAVLTGAAHAYLHAGGQYEWDSCAPVGVALAAGLHASRIDGSPCRYNQPDPWMPDLLICRPELADLILDATAKAKANQTTAP